MNEKSNNTIPKPVEQGNLPEIDVNAAYTILFRALMRTKAQSKIGIKNISEAIHEQKI